jgi:hypothetical protein
MTTVAFKDERTDALPVVPPDIGQSIQELGATCGPVSVAAVFGTSVVEVMRFFPGFPQKNWVTSADMRYALDCAGARWERRSCLPRIGVALIQLEGPWTSPGAPVRAQLGQTHWVACRNGYVLDLNIGDWLEMEEWLCRGAASWMQSVPRCTGFSLREAFDITPQRFEFSPYGRVPRRSLH